MLSRTTPQELEKTIANRNLKESVGTPDVDHDGDEDDVDDD